MAEEKQAEEAPAKSNKKLIIIIAAVALLAGGGGAAFFMMKPSSEEGAHKEEVHEEVKPSFMTLETFTVNLVPDPGEQYLQADISLQIKDPHAEEAIKEKMPLVKSSVLMVLSSKKSSEINTMEGKKALSKELVASLNHILNPNAKKSHDDEHESKEEGEHGEDSHKEGSKGHHDKDQAVTGVFFTSFIIQ